MLNKYVWDNYLKAGGSEIVKMFRDSFNGEYTKEYGAQIRYLASKYCPLDEILDDLKARLLELCDFVISDDFAKEKELLRKKHTSENDIVSRVLTDDYAEISDIIEQELQTEASPQRVFDYFIRDIAGDSTIFAMVFPDLFVPYYFQYNFNVLEIIAEQFDIDLPRIPLKKDYEERYYYYGEVCKALNIFRVDNALSPYELWAFLYDFAPNYIGGLDSYLIKELPEPRGAFFIGGSEDDIGLSDNPLALWQCNEETRVGDMIVMYFKTPVSAIDSVWRACSVGFIDPFFYYYRCTYIGNRKKINHVTQKMMKDDPIISALPIVRKNMQGINGVELLPSEYNHLMDMAGVELFRFQYEEESISENISREKDVEDKLIKPLLLKLGYEEKDYTQQLYIEIGNHNHALIPDFVLLPNRSAGHSSAFAIIEAKKTIPNDKVLEETKTQARSYANQLKTRYSVVASKEKIWIMSEKDDYSKDIFIAAWAELYDPDVFYQLEKMIGFH